VNPRRSPGSARGTIVRADAEQARDLRRSDLRDEDVPQRQAAIDEAARAAGRDPAAIERAVNVMELEGDAGSWAGQLARIAGELRFSTLLVSVPGEDPVGFVRRLGEDIAPRARELLA
jgi:hypothetical protein